MKGVYELCSMGFIVRKILLGNWNVMFIGCCTVGGPIIVWDLVTFSWFVHKSINSKLFHKGPTLAYM